MSKVTHPSLPDIQKHVVQLCLAAKAASQALALTSLEVRNRALEAMARALADKRDDILFRNEIDVEAGRKAGVDAALLDRLTLTAQRIEEMARGLRDIARLPDPLGEVVNEWDAPAGVHVRKIRVPLGVIAMIYEARPNVTVDSAGLCLKSGNAVVLRGGKEALNSNTALLHIIAQAAASEGVPVGSMQLVETTDRGVIRELARMDKFIDLVIPRGGEEMVQAVREMATVPVLSHGKGLCSVYVDKDADPDMAQRIAYNAKVQRPGVCNAMETLLVHRDMAPVLLPKLVDKYRDAKVEVRGDADAQRLGGRFVKPAQDQDWDTEFLGLVVAVRVVDSLEKAIQHINVHGSHHSDAIVTNNASAADKFLREVDSAAVFHNASTRLHDGGALGLGAEMGISTQKLHARGTMGLRELTTTKYVIQGTGQIRQ
jgi:glutamate-5-semialdehyde dehydrogenase